MSKWSKNRPPASQRWFLATQRGKGIPQTIRHRLNTLHPEKATSFSSDTRSLQGRSCEPFDAGLFPLRRKTLVETRKGRRRGSFTHPLMVNLVTASREPAALSSLWKSASLAITFTPTIPAATHGRRGLNGRKAPAAAEAAIRRPVSAQSPREEGGRRTPSMHHSIFCAGAGSSALSRSFLNLSRASHSGSGIEW